jgi:hypothetical protein
MKLFGMVLLAALALAGPADAMTGDDLLADLDRLIGKEVLLTDANVGGAGNDGAAFKISDQGIDRETFGYLLENCHMVTEPPECQGLRLLVTLSGQKSPSGRPILINVKRAQP